MYKIQGYNNHGYNNHGYNNHGFNNHGYNDHVYNGQILYKYFLSNYCILKHTEAKGIHHVFLYKLLEQKCPKTDNFNSHSGKKKLGKNIKILF